jgi:hypothetical protein
MRYRWRCIAATLRPDSRTTPTLKMPAKISHAEGSFRAPPLLWLGARLVW